MSLMSKREGTTWLVLTLGPLGPQVYETPHENDAVSMARTARDLGRASEVRLVKHVVRNGVLVEYRDVEGW